MEKCGKRCGVTGRRPAADRPWGHGRWCLVGTVVLTATGFLPAGAQTRDDTSLPVVTVSGPSVIAFWEVPASDSVLMANPDLASALDEQQYYWADSRGRLAELGIAAVDQPGRQFRIRDRSGERVFRASPDSAVVGYVLVEPGRDVRVLYRVQYPDNLIARARRYFGIGQR